MQGDDLQLLEDWSVNDVYENYSC